MNDLRSQVLDEVDQLEKLQAELAAISNRTDDERLRELIQLRRQLSEQVGRVGKIAERYFEESGAPDLIRQFRSHFTNMRSKAATHQANWPAVRLHEAGDEYQRSAKAVREANRALVSWMRAALK